MPSPPATQKTKTGQIKMRTKYYTKSSKYYTKYNQAKRNLNKWFTILGNIALCVIAYCFLYLIMVAAGAKY